MRAAVETYSVQREAYRDVRADIHALLARISNSGISPARCDWLYAGNPAGAAVLWTLRRGVALVGYTVAVPRAIAIRGEVVRGWIGADFIIDPRWRTLGPALKLRRAARDAIERGEVELLYSFPNERMAAIHRRVGNASIGVLDRLVLPLRSEAYVKRRLGDSPLAGIVTRLGDAALRLRYLSKRRRPAFPVRTHSPPVFDKRYDELFERASIQHTVVGHRGSAYLDWRFSNNPRYPATVIEISPGDCLLGYLVMSYERESVNIRDLFVDTQSEVTRDLLTAAIRVATDIGAANIIMNILHCAPQYDHLARLGFVRREGSDRVFVHGRSGSIAVRAHQHEGWHLLTGDRDI